MSQLSTAQPGDIKQFLRISQVAAPLVDQLHGAHAEAVAGLVSSAAGWHGPSDIPTLEGLGGACLWLENWLAIARISFRFDPEHAGSQGNYEIILGLSTLEHGVFYCVPNNPAIGWAGITLVPAHQPKPRSFVVAGMLTDADWRIQMLLLNKLDASGLVQPPFPASRIL